MKIRLNRKKSKMKKSKLKFRSTRKKGGSLKHTSKNIYLMEIKKLLKDPKLKLKKINIVKARKLYELLKKDNFNQLSKKNHKIALNYDIEIYNLEHDYNNLVLIRTLLEKRPVNYLKELRTKLGIGRGSVQWKTKEGESVAMKLHEEYLSHLISNQSSPLGLHHFLIKLKELLKNKITDIPFYYFKDIGLNINKNVKVSNIHCLTKLIKALEFDTFIVNTLDLKNVAIPLLYVDSKPLSSNNKKHIVKYLVDILTTDTCSSGGDKRSVQPLLNKVKSSKRKIGERMVLT